MSRSAIRPDDIFSPHAARRSPVEASKSTASCGQLPPPAGTNKAPELQDIAVSVSEQNHETKDEGTCSGFITLM